MRNLLALLLFVPSLCLAQLPDYVPADGLVAWWALDGDGSDQSEQENDGNVFGATPTSGPMGFRKCGHVLYQHWRPHRIR